MSKELTANDLTLQLSQDLGHWGSQLYRIWLDEEPERILKLKKKGELIPKLLRINLQMLKKEEALRKEMRNSLPKAKTSMAAVEQENQIRMQVREILMEDLKVHLKPETLMPADQ